MIQFTGIRRVSHTEGRLADATEAASQTMAERVIAGWELAEHDFFSGNNDASTETLTASPIDLEKKRPAFTLRRVRRS